MPFREHFKRRSDKGDSAGSAAPQLTNEPQNAAFTIVRSDTQTQEILAQPGTLQAHHRPRRSNDGRVSSAKPKSWSRSSSVTSSTSTRSHRERSLTGLLKLRPGSRESSVSAVVPSDLPTIDAGVGTDEEREAKWEQRATRLAQSATQRSRSPSAAASHDHRAGGFDLEPGFIERPAGQRQISDVHTDDDIREAIRLHEDGELAQSAAIFKRLADDQGANNALAQVLYGMALRHGWGIPADPPGAVRYLTQAASNSAAVEASALASGLRKGGAAKGELVLAIFELANCYRQGWGVDKDPVAARAFYETAANLGDTDAMIECARCYEVGIGGKKDKYLAAKYFRLAEEKGNKIMGNSWIWKDKYTPK